MYGKIFKQIFASSVAQDYKVRHVFMDLITLADSEGIVDMTIDSIAGFTRVPQDDLRTAIEILEKPDPQSRSPEFEGARLVRLDSHRNWGWRIVNYSKYREIASEEQRKELSRKRSKKYRQRTNRQEDATKRDASVTVRDSHTSPSACVRGMESAERKGVIAPAQQSEIDLYANQIGLPHDEAEKFFDHYESNGWMVGKNRMKNWKAAVRNWKRGCDKGTYANKSNSKQRVDRSIGTANEGTADLYRGLRPPPQH